MIKSVLLDEAYNEAALTKLVKAFEKYPSVQMQEISLWFASHPGIRFVFTGETITHIITQANLTERLLKEAGA